MRETAPNHEPRLTEDEIQREFTLITNNFELEPDGPLFSAFWHAEVDVDDLASRRQPTELELKASKEAAKEAAKNGEAYEAPRFRPVVTNGLILVAEVLHQTGLIQDSETLEDLTNKRQALLEAQEGTLSETDHKYFRAIDNLVKIHEISRTLLVHAYDTYYSEEYWEDVEHKTGLKTDRIEFLHAVTDAYEDQGLLGALKKVEQSGKFTTDIIFEANRIARILVAREVNAIE